MNLCEEEVSGHGAVGVKGDISKDKPFQIDFYNAELPKDKVSNQKVLPSKSIHQINNNALQSS